MAGELQDFFSELGRRAVNRADIVEMEIVAAVRRGDAPRGEIAVEGNARADLIGSRAENLGGDLRGCRFMGLPAIGRTRVQGQRAVLFQLDGRAVDAAGAGRL